MNQLIVTEENGCTITSVWVFDSKKPPKRLITPYSVHRGKRDPFNIAYWKAHGYNLDD